MESFGSRVGHEIPRLRRYALALTRDAVAADDLVQESVARALSKQKSWQEGTDLRAWLFTILHNQYVSQVRRAMREARALGELRQIVNDAPAPAKSLELRDTERALGRLPALMRSAVLLVGLYDLPYEDVARIQGVPVGTVRSRLSRGREMLRQLSGWAGA